MTEERKRIFATFGKVIPMLDEEKRKLMFVYGEGLIDGAQLEREKITREMMAKEKAAVAAE